MDAELEPKGAHHRARTIPDDAGPDAAPDTSATIAGGRSTIGIRELRATLAIAVRRADAGERLVVTSGGRPVAQLGPLADDAPQLVRLVASGAVLPPRRRGTWRPPEPVPVWPGVRLDQILRELRG